MKTLQLLFKFYINASIHVALAVLAFVALTEVEFKVNLPVAFWFFIFFGSVTGYNFVKYAKIAGLHHSSLTHSLQLIQVFSLLCLGGLLYCCFFLSFQTLWVAACLGLFTLLYAVPVVRKKNLRTFSGIKIIVVAMVWGGVTVLLPIVEANLLCATDCWITFFQRFLLVVVLTLPFEIRDLPYDVAQLKTIPQQVGVKKTKIFGAALLLLALFLEGGKDDFSQIVLYAYVILIGMAGLSLMLAKRRQTIYYASFWVESIPIIGWSALLLFRYFTK